MVGAQKKMVFGPAGWFKNARNDDVAAILSFGGASDSYVFVLSFFLQLVVARLKSEDKAASFVPL
jgi:hypothetical protein